MRRRSLFPHSVPCPCALSLEETHYAARHTLAFIVVLIAAVGVRPSADVNVRDTRLLHQPATSGTHVAFIYADDLWVGRLDGRDLRRLTTDYGVESSPAFSPDGALIAFTAQYDGNRDVYTVPVDGGVPKRLTWHPGADEVQGFTPDGRRVLFTSPRSVFTTRYTQLFTVALDGGMPDFSRFPTPPAGPTRPTPAGSLTTPSRLDSNSGSNIEAARSLGFGFMTRRAMPSRKSRSQRLAPTTSTPCGLATSSTSGRIGTASSISTRTNRDRSAFSD